MKILILSCNTGGGHNTAAFAIKKAAEERGHTAVVKDYLLFSSERRSRFLSDLYINTAKYLPYLFGAVYTVGKWVSYLPFKSPVYLANRKRAEALKEYVEKEGFDAVMATHLYPAEAMTRLKRIGAEMPPTFAVATDYTCIPFWNELECDYYIAPHEDLCREYIRRKIPSDKIFPLGIPVDSSFSQRKDKKEAKKALGFDENRNLFLIMSGSMGFGRVPLFAKLLYGYAQNAQIAVICGNNEKMVSKLRKNFGENADVRIIGFTDKVAEYMAACDVIYTKPGGLTSTEALVSAAPTIHTAPIPGCESKNYRFFGKNGISVHAKNMVTQILFGTSLAENTEKRKKMEVCQRQHAKPNAASDIVSLAEKCYSNTEVYIR